MQVVEQIDREPFREVVLEDVRMDFVVTFGPELPHHIVLAAQD